MPGAGYDISASVSASSSFASNPFLDNEGSGINFGTESLAGATYVPNTTSSSAATTSKGAGSPAETNLSANAPAFPTGLKSTAAPGATGASQNTFLYLLIGGAALAAFLIFRK